MWKYCDFVFIDLCGESMTHLPHVSQIWDQGFLKQRFINIGNPGCHMCHDDWAWLAIISRRFVASEVKHNLICCIRRQTHESCCDLHSYIGAAYKSQHTDESHCSLPVTALPATMGVVPHCWSESGRAVQWCLANPLYCQRSINPRSM